MTDDPKGTGTTGGLGIELRQATVQLELPASPQTYFAATSVHLLDRRTNFILLYLVEDGNEEPPRGLELLLTPTALQQFAESGKTLLAHPACSRVKDVIADQPQPRRWSNFSQAGVSACSHAVANDLVGSDFYFLLPRTVGAALEANAKTGAPISLRGDPVVTCGVDIWQFKAVVQKAVKLLEARASELGPPLAGPTVQLGGRS